jgi:hypothetical protein
MSSLIIWLLSIFFKPNVFHVLASSFYRFYSTGNLTIRIRAAFSVAKNLKFWLAFKCGCFVV